MTYKHLCKAWTVAAVAALSVAIIVLAPGLIDKASKALDKLLPPDLPEYTRPEQARWLDQNWSAENRYWFHHASQGTSTLPVPYKWFVALEQPRLWLFGGPPMFKDSEYLGRFGFIPSPTSLETEDPPLADYGYLPEVMEAYSDRSLAYDAVKFAGNDDGLPVGFARLDTEPRKKPTAGKKPLDDRIGFTCAACHTGQLEFDGVTLLIDGAPAVTDLGKFNKALSVALIYTKIVPFRFGRFADRVLGADHSPKDEEDLKKELYGLLDKGAKRKAITDPVSEHDIAEGFTRLDALNRIGNTVFFEDLMEWDPVKEEWIEAVAGMKDNYAPLTAPVNYPQLWDTAWFQWVQYDASIMQPMIRNAGEALGVKARINLINPGPQLFSSQVRVDEIHDLEKLLAGKNPFLGDPGFKGLKAPQWPGDTDPDMKDDGRKLYAELCQGCHLPPVNDPGWPKNDPTVATFWDPKFWTAPNAAKESYLKFTKYKDSNSGFANLVAVGYVGTDPAQAEVMVKRQVRIPLYLGIDPGILCDIPSEGAVDKTKFAFALAVVVEKAVNKWYDDNQKSPAERERMNGYRPNCIKGEMFYKARPLDGIWATAPFLHNGAVPNLSMLLSPVADRVRYFCLGDREYDPANVGYKFQELEAGESCDNGKTLVDTSISGNSNKGHEFKDGDTGGGVIGRFLEVEEREALIEYVKSL